MARANIVELHMLDRPLTHHEVFEAAMGTDGADLAALERLAQLIGKQSTDTLRRCLQRYKFGSLLDQETILLDELNKREDQKQMAALKPLMQDQKRRITELEKQLRAKRRLSQVAVLVAVLLIAVQVFGDGSPQVLLQKVTAILPG